MGIFSVLGDWPLSYDVFAGESASRGKESIFFLELELRDNRGFITGELEKYSVVKDEEAHRPVVLRDAKRKSSVELDEDLAMAGDRVPIDLADALTVQISYQARAQPLEETQTAGTDQWEEA
jgi:hypothetical protein